MVVGRRLRAVALLGALAPQLGCSFLFVDKPTVSAGYAQGSKCTSAPIAPAIDLALMLWQGARFVSAAGSDDNDYDGGELSRGAVMSSGMLLFMLFGASMVSGFTHTSTCREAQEVAKEPLRPEVEPRIDPLPRPAIAPAAGPAASPDTGNGPAAPAAQVIPAAAADGGQPIAADGGEPLPPPPQP
jgi:hypothetical protein